MGTTPSRLFAYSIQSLAFTPPQTPGYGESEAEYVKTIDNLRIAIMLVRPAQADEARCVADPPNDMRRRGGCDGAGRDLILYSHGNAEDMGGAKDHGHWLADNLDCDVVLFDYVNYGHSSVGLMSEENMYRAIDAVFEYVSHELPLKHKYKHLFLMGRSLGTTASVHLASKIGRHQGLYKGLILQSPLASGFRVLCHAHNVPDSICRVMDRVFCPVVQEVGRVEQPVFVIHGTRDEIVCIENAHDVQSKVQTKCYYPPLYIEAGHNDIELRFPDILIDELRRFIHYCKTGNMQADIPSSSYT